MTYELVKSAHIFFVIAWMVGFLYLPRLMVYHAEATAGGEHSETLKVMERKLLRGIMTPSMIITWVLGIWLASLMDVWSDPWLHAKLLFVVILSGVHMWLAARVRDFANDRNTKSSKFFRIINEVPAVALIIIILLVIIKPF